MNPNHYLAVAIEYLLATSPAVVARSGRRQDAGLERADRPRRRRPRPAPVRGAGRLQVVRAGLARRQHRLRRRGERRGVVPAARRQRVDDRQGRHHPRPAGGGDHRGHRQGPRRAVPGTRRAVRGALLRAHRRAGDTGAEDRVQGAHRRARDGDATLAGDTHRRAAHPRAGERCVDRRAQGRHRQRLVRGATVGHRGHLQALRRELRRAPSTSQRIVAEAQQIVGDALAA